MSSFRILILGGGFTGLTVARELAKHRELRLTLVSESSHALFTPRLVDALAQTCPEIQLHKMHQAIAERAGYSFLQAHATAIHPTEKTVLLETASGPTIESYDVLVCAMGAETNFFGLKGQEHVFPLKTWEHLLTIEERLRTFVPRTHAHIAVVGGGPTGIETAVALHLRLTRLGIKKSARAITIYQAGPQILQGFLPNTIIKTTRLLKEYGIEVFCGASVMEASASTLLLSDGHTHTSDLTVWASGVRPRLIPFEGEATLTTNRALTTDHHLRLMPHIFAGGDVISYKDRQMIVPKNAQTAINMGHLIAHNILRMYAKKHLASFSYRSPGVMLWLGTTAIADLFGRSIASPLFLLVRAFLYRFRWWQLTR